MWADIALLIGTGLALVFLATDHRRLQWLAFALASISGLMHVVLQGHRWQMIPVYLAFALILFLLVRGRSQQPGKLGLAAGVLLVSLSIGLSWALPVFSFSTPDWYSAQCGITR